VTATATVADGGDGFGLSVTGGPRR
jgi:hypothetical protein